MAGNHGSGASRSLSTSDFNARAKALSDRLGEIAKPEERKRQWSKPKPWSRATGPSGPAREPDSEPTESPEESK